MMLKWPYFIFLWLNNIPMCVCVCVCVCVCMCVLHLLIQLSVNGHLGCFHILAIINSAAVNIWVYVSF